MSQVTSAAVGQRRRGVLIAGLLIAMLFGALDQTVVSTAMPRIVGDLGGLGQMAWLTTAYMLTSTTVVPIAGKLADLLGRRVVYVSGLLVFVAGSALCGAAQSMNQLIVFRAFQGVGGGIMMPMAMIIVGDLFTGSQRAKWQGVFGGLFGLASLVGPQLGGWVVDVASWRWVFYLNLPIALLAVVLIAYGLEGRPRQGRVQIDWAGMLTLVTGVVSLLLTLSLGGKRWPWNAAPLLGLMLLTVLSLAGFVWLELRVPEPVIPVRLLRNRTFTLVNGVGFLMSVGMFGSLMFVPLLLQGILGISPSASGTAMTPMMLAMMAASALGGRLALRLGVRPQLALGMAVMAASFWCLTQTTLSTHSWVITLDLVVLGCGMGLVMPLLTLALQQSFPREQLGVVTSSSQFFRQIGGTFGMTLLGAVLNARSSGALLQQLSALPGGFNALQGMPDPRTNAQGLFSALLNPDLLHRLPAAVAQPLADVLKSTLIHALHAVFTVSLVCVLSGVVLSLGLNRISLHGRPASAASASEQPAVPARAGVAQATPGVQQQRETWAP
ncbi:MAG: MFS transporter [Alicyclobacillus sp.]|nr:MFS transporter [Alicyclobacillus sp.]